MQKVTFGGKEYVRATVIAKKFKYTADYVGQLCRSGKVDARRVGRNWYINLESVIAYRKTKHQTQKKSTSRSAATQNPRSPKPTSKRVPPVPRAKTVKATQRRSVPLSRYTLAVAYDTDDSQLIPVIGPAPKPKNAPKKKTVTIRRQSATQLKVQNSSTPVTFKSEKLPEITLSGKLKVDSYKTQKSTNSPRPESVEQPANSHTPKEKPIQPAKLANTEDEVAVSNSTSQQKQSESTTVTKAVSQAPQSTQAHRVLKTPRGSHSQAEQKPIGNGGRFFAWAGFSVLVIFVVLGVLSLGQEILVVGDVYQVRYTLDVQTLTKIITP